MVENIFTKTYFCAHLSLGNLWIIKEAVEKINYEIFQHICE